MLGGLEEMWKTVVLWPRTVAEHCKGGLNGQSLRSLEDNSVGAMWTLRGSPTHEASEEQYIAAGLETMLVTVRQRTWLLLPL